MFVLLCALVVTLVIRGSASLGYQWQWYRVGRYLVMVTPEGLVAGQLLAGLAVTFKITAISMILALVFGLLAALMRLSRSWSAAALSRIYLEFIRNTPLLIQLFCMYFMLAPILGISAFASAVLSLSLFEGAYLSEIMRAGIVSIPRGQWDAAYSLGIGGLQTYVHIILPQALRQILPPLTGQFISLVKDSALVSTIAIYDLTMQGQAIVAQTFLAFEIWFTVAAIYLAITLALSRLATTLDKRLRARYV